ncbi:MAG: hypothetical protein AB1632_05685 [Nitrospirota bacterium]
MPNDSAKTDKRSGIAGKIRKVLRVLFFILLVAIVLFEGYYIFVLRDRMRRQKEELENITIQLQSLKNERDDLHEELSSARKLAGEKTHGNTSER